MIFTVRYADGWDGALVNPIDAAEAAARDADGGRYAVLLRAGGSPRAVLHVAGRDGYVGVVVLGDDGRRRAVLHLRRTPAGDLFLRERRTWPDGEGPDAPRHTTTWTLAGRREDTGEPAGPRGGSRRTFADERPPRIPAPGFGDWAGLLGLAGVPDPAGAPDPAQPLDPSGPPTSAAALGPARPGRVVLREDTADDLPVTTAAAPPWQPPRPAAPGDLAALFTPGAEVSFGRHRAVLETVAAGPLRLTSGRLVAADPGILVREPAWFTVPVPPGVYPMTVAAARFVERPDRRRVAAARLEISGAPVARWAMALSDGQSELDLGAGEFYGFGVDSGLGSFADADLWETVAAAGDDERDAWEDSWIALGDRAQADLAVTVDGGSIVAWPSGWGDGSYPTWAGYAADGAVACFVADMRL